MKSVIPLADVRLTVNGRAFSPSEMRNRLYDSGKQKLSLEFTKRLIEMFEADIEATQCEIRLAETQAASIKKQVESAA